MELGEVCLRTSKIINEISVKFDWVFLKVIHLDVNLDVNSQPFFMYFCKVPSAGITATSCKLGEVWWELQKLLMRLMWNLNELFLKVIHLDVNLDVNSQPFSM